MNKRQTTSMQDTTTDSIFNSLQISNYKSINDLTLPLSRFNVFIGSNGCGKSNILEAVAFLAVQRDARVKISDLQLAGVRITKPSLMMNSFLGRKSKGGIAIKMTKGSVLFNTDLGYEEEDDIFSDWIDTSDWVGINDQSKPIKKK